MDIVLSDKPIRTLYRFRTVDGCEILHHLGWLNPINHGINHLSTGAGFRNHPPYTLTWDNHHNLNIIILMIMILMYDIMRIIDDK